MGENTDRIKGFFTHSGKSGVLIFIFLGAVIGIILILSGGKRAESGETAGITAPDSGISDYRAEQENKIASLVSNVGGAGRVSVAISLDGGFEYVYAQNTADKSGGSAAYVTVGNGSSESAVYIRTKTPAIGGIGVVCDGGNDPGVRMEIVNLLSAVYGIGSNKIYVTGRKSE